MDAGNQVTRELTDAEKARLGELDEAITKFEGQKRWSDVIKTILAKAEIVVEPADKIDLLTQAGQMYVEKSSNQAEAIKCFEQVIEIDSHNIAAITSLKEMYEKRRDWEKLVRAMEREADLLEPADRGVRYIEMAQLATERLRKPEICIDLWQKVLRYDEENVDALGALASLYERAREWQPLTEVLEKQSGHVSDTEEQKALLTKLGMIYADKLSDDRGAVSAFQRLLAIDPDDRRAQEQLKRRYVAIKAWDDLEAFYQSSGKLDELIRTLEREAQNKDAATGEQIDLLFRVARLWMQSEKADRAAKAYEKVLELDADSHDAAVALAPLYEAAGDAKKLAGVIEVRLKHVTDPEERIVLLREVGVLYEEKLKRKEDAFARYLEAFQLDAMRDILREDVARLAPAVDGWDQVIAGYAKAIAAASPGEPGGDEESQIALRLSLGAVLVETGKIDEAIAQYRAVYDAQSDHMGAIEALERLYRQTGRNAELLEVYDRRMELEQDPDARRKMAYGRASLLENELADADQAIDAYQAILAEWGDEEQDAWRALDTLFEKQTRWQDLAGALERRIDLGPSSEEELAALKFRLARVLEQHLARKADALELLREVVTLVPEHDGARLALEAMLPDPQVGSSAAAILEPIYESQGAWPSLIRALEVLVAAAPADGEVADPERKLELLTKIGEVAAGQIGDLTQAFDAFARGLRVMPEHEETLERLEAIALEQERFADLVKLVEELATDAQDPALSRRLWIRAARTQDAQLGVHDAAVAAYAKVLEQDPGDAEVLDALDELYRRTERYRDLVGVLRRKAELSGELETQAQLLGSVAEIHEAMLGEPTAAISIFKEILELDPESRSALGSLDRLFEKQEMWSDLADNIGRQLQIASDPEEQSALMLRLATLRETRMGATDAAIEIHREVLERDPSNAEALAALERLLQTPAHQAVITDILEPLYRDANEFAKLIGVHEIQAALATSPERGVVSERRVELLHRIAELYEIAIDDAPSAFASYARALGEDAGNGTTQEQLERIAAMTGDFEGLATTYEQRAARFYEESESGRPSEEETPLAAALLTKAAEIREVQLGDFETAIAHHQRVLDLNADSSGEATAALHLGAASSLERLYQQAERYEPLAQILLKKAAMLDSPDEQKEHLFRAAAIHEEILERPLDAIEVYKKVLEVDAEELQALDKLIELFLRLESWSELLGIYEKKADVVADPDEKKRLYLEVGAVYERELAQGEKAIDIYQKILEIDPDDLMAIGRLDALYQATSNWQELRSILEREAELAGDPDEVISYKFRIADLYDHKLDDAQRAVDGYAEILGVVPDHTPTLDALEAMIRANKLPVAAALTLEPVYQQAGEWAKLVAALEVQVAHAEDPRAKVELLHRIAQLQELQLDSARAAFDAYARAVPQDSSDPDTLENLERLASDLNAFGEVTKLYDAEIEKLAEEPDRKVEMALRVAQIYEVQQGDVDSAIARYNAVVAVDETHEQAIESLDRLYEASGRWSDLAETLGKEIQLASSPEAMLDFQHRLGLVYQLHLGQVDRAIEQYKEILAAAPEHAPALAALEQLFAEGVQPLVIGEILEPLYRMQEAFDRLIGVQEVALEHQSDATERVGMMHKIAEIAEERAGEPQIAFEWHQRVLLEDPLNDQSVAETERLAGALGTWEQLASTLADVLEQRATAEIRVPVGKRLARVYEEQVNDVERAVEAHLFVLQSEPKDLESLEALDRLYSEHGASEALQEILARRAAATTDPRDLVELHFRRAQVLENDLGRIDEAVGVYTQILDTLDAENEGSIQALANIYVEKQDWPSLFKTFERELKVALGDTGRADVLAKMARLAEDHLHDAAKAIQLWKEVLELRGEDQEGLSALGDLYAKGEKWTELVDVLDREAAIVPDDESRVQVFSDLGRVWYAKLRNERNAVDNWQRVLDIDPTNTNALFALVEIQRAGGHTQELVDTLHRVVEVGTATLDEGTLETVYMQLGELYERTLQQPADAVDAYNKAVELNPRNFAAMDALEGIHTVEGQWTDKIQVMEKRVLGLDESAPKIAVLLAVAQTWAEKVEEPDRGTSAFERILELDPRHDYAFTRLDELHREAAASDARRWDNLVEMFITRTETAETSAERVDLLRRIAEVQGDKLEDKNQAFDTLLLAWEDDYTDRRTADDLEKVTGATRKWNDLLNHANTALTQATDPQIKISICLRCAKWYSLELKHPEYAIPYYQQIQQLDPGNVPAQQQLADLYRSTQQWQLLAQTLGAIVNLTGDPRIKAETYTQMGELCETHLAIPDQARSYFLQAVDADPTYVPGLEALEAVHRAAEEWDALLDIQRRKANALDDPQELIEAKLQIAETFEDRLGNADEAIATYRQVLDADDQNLRALKGLERLYAQTERWADLLQILERQYDVVSTEKERIGILLRVAGMWEEEFAKRETAAERLEKVLEIGPSNDTALRSLERIYRQMQRWDALINTYDRHVQSTPDRTEKQEILAAMGDVYALELNDLDRAIDAYLNILAINGASAKAHEALSRLYDKRGDHGQAYDSMLSLSKLLSDPQQVVELRFRMGKLLDEQLGDRATAVEQYQSALDIEPGHLESLEAMRKIHIDGGDWLAAAKALEQEAQYQQQPRVIAKLLVELARLYDERLDEHDRAIETYEAAFKQDEDNEDAALPLADEYSKTEKHAQALPLLDMLVKRSAKREPSEQHRLGFMLGEAALKTGDTEAAIKALTKASSLDAQHLPTLLLLSSAYYQAQNWDQAFKYYQMLLVHHRDALGKDEITDVFFKLGVIKREQGDRRKALNMFDKALEEDAQHRPTLEAVVGLYQSASDWEQVIHFKKKILELTDGDERVNMLDEIGDLWNDKLKNPQKAIESFAEALEQKPKDHKLMHKLLGLYQSTKQWDQTIDIIQRVSDLDDRAAAKSKYAYTIAVILRDEVKDADRALEAFNKSLDLDPTQLKAFEAINKILNTKKDWKQLERAYRKMLHRLKDSSDDELKFNLSHALGVIYRDRMKQPESAVEAFKIALAHKPEEATEHQILAELYAVIPGRVDDAIAEHQWLLRQDPYRVDSYQALYKLYFDARQYDKAWCLSATLSFLKKADAEQTQFFEQYRQKGPIRPASRLDNERWLKDLVHPDQDLVTSKIFEVLWPAILSVKGKTDKDAGATPKYQVDPANSTVTLARTYGFVSQVLGMASPRLFLRQDVPGGLTHLPVYPLASLCGSTLLQGFQPQDLMFVCARHLSDYRGEHYIRTLLPSNTELKTVLMAGLAIAGLVPANDPALVQTIQALQPKLQPAQIDALRSLGKRFLEAGARTDIKRWLQCVELTACRAGFLIANDLETAARMITALGAAGPADLPPKDKVKELVLFSVSEEYFRLRQALGIQLSVA